MSVWHALVCQVLHNAALTSEQSEKFWIENTRVTIIIIYKLWNIDWPGLFLVFVKYLMSVNISTSSERPYIGWVLKRMGYVVWHRMWHCSLSKVQQVKWWHFTLYSGCDLSFSQSDFQSRGFTSHDSVSLPDFCRIDELLCKDENAILSFEAIRNIHKQMDDDANGNVDVVETDGVSRSKITVIKSGLLKTDIF